MIDDPCEFFRKIHADPMARVTPTIGEFFALKDHLTKCEECARLTDEVIERFKDVPPSPDQTRLN